MGVKAGGLRLCGCSCSRLLTRQRQYKRELEIQPNMATQQNTQQRRFIWKDLAFTTSSSMKASFRGLGGGVGKKKGGIEGTWSPPDEESKVTIHRDEKTGSLVGRISWLKDSERVHQRDFRNPRRELRDR